MIFGVALGIVIMAAVSYMALNKKSNFHTRLVSLAALAVMIITVIICLIIVLSDNRVPIDPSTLIVGAPVEVKEDNNLLGLVLSIIFLLAMFIVIVFLAMKEHKKSNMKKK